MAGAHTGLGIVLSLAVGAVSAAGPTAEPTPPEPTVAACEPAASGWQASAQDLADELAGVTDPTASALRDGLAAAGFTAGSPASAPRRPAETEVDLGGETGADGTDPDAAPGRRGERSDADVAGATPADPPQQSAPPQRSDPSAGDPSAGDPSAADGSGADRSGADPGTGTPGAGGPAAGAPGTRSATPPRTPAQPAPAQPDSPPSVTPRATPTPPAGPSAQQWEELADELARELTAAHDAAARELADHLSGELGATGDPRARELADRLSGVDGVVPMWERLTDWIIETVKGILAPALEEARQGRSGTPVPPAHTAAPDEPGVPDEPAERSTAPDPGCDDTAAAPAGGEPGAGVVPAGAKLLFRSDFEDGFGAWSTCQNAFMNSGCEGAESAGHALTLVEDAREGRLAARFEVQSGDVPDFGGGERSEVAAHDEAMATREGDERWYAFSLKFDEQFQNPAGGDWFIIMQWHAGSGSPPLAIEVSPDGNLQFGGDGVDHDKKVIGPVRPGEWVDYVVHAGFSSSDGFVEAWENGVQTVQRSARATMSSGENYFKMGIYRGNDDSSTAAVLFDGLTVWGPAGSGGGTAAGGGSGTGAPGGGADDGDEGGGGEGGDGRADGGGSGDGGDPAADPGGEDGDG